MAIAPSPGDSQTTPSCLASAHIAATRQLGSQKMHRAVVWGLLAMSLAGGAPAALSLPSQPAGVEFGGSAYAFPFGRQVQGGIADGEVWTFGGGAGTPYTGQVASWGRADSSLAQMQGLLQPEASVWASATQQTSGGAEAIAGLAYRVLLVADDAAAAGAMAQRIASGDALATVNGSWQLAAQGWAYSSVLAITGASVPGLDANLVVASKHSCGASGAQTLPGAAGCGDGGFSLPIHFMPTLGMQGGDALSFVSTITLYSMADAGGSGANFIGTSSAFIDPTVTIAAGLHGMLFLGDGGNVANSVPEPASWALLLAGVAGLLAWRHTGSPGGLRNR